MLIVLDTRMFYRGSLIFIIMMMNIDMKLAPHIIPFMPLQMVLDTNVLVAALKSSQGSSYRLLSLIDDGRFVLNVSTPLVAEYEEVLRRECKHLESEVINDILDYLCSVANRHKIFYLWRPVLKDPDDDLVLELAVKSGADIVTWNVRDFDKANTFSISVLTPNELLRKIGEIT